MERITSRNNQLIKDIKKLQTSAQERAARSLFVLEGARLCFDVLRSVLQPVTVLITESCFDRYREQAQALAERSEAAYLITDEVAAKLSDTGTAQGIFSVCRRPQSVLPTGQRLLVLDRVQDPANVGTIIRTAEAFGLDGMITAGCCDVYNPKVLRATMGGVLRLTPYDTDNLPAVLQTLRTTHRVYATVPDRAARSITEADFSGACACIIGNEANGISAEILALADERITIPMDGHAESLNAGIAAAVTMWEMVRN